MTSASQRITIKTNLKMEKNEFYKIKKVNFKKICKHCMSLNNILHIQLLKITENLSGILYI